MIEMPFAEGIIRAMKAARIFLAIWAALVWASVAACADGHDPGPEIEGKVPWMAITYSVVALAGIAVVGFKNAKRTHLD
jgi:hypothetical protein